MSKKTVTVLSIVLLVLGFAIVCYPSVSDFVNGLNGSYAIAQLRRIMDNTGTEEQKAQRALAEAYNRALLLGEEEGYDDILNISDGMMGYLEIGKIKVNLPIYHGVGEDVLAKGVGHMPQSAFPIGGTGNHAVLTGHTGLPSARLLTDLTKLEEGDSFAIHILGQELRYQVDQIKVVLPSEGQDLAAEPGKDYCTLVTCTPYGINSHRLLVRGSRVEEEPQTEAQPLQDGRQTRPTWLVAAMVLAVLTLPLTIFLLLKRKG